jgi:hypothetical protein
MDMQKCQGTSRYKVHHKFAIWDRHSSYSQVNMVYLQGTECTLSTDMECVTVSMHNGRSYLQISAYIRS